MVFPADIEASEVGEPSKATFHFPAFLEGQGIFRRRARLLPLQIFIPDGPMWNIVLKSSLPQQGSKPRSIIGFITRELTLLG